MYILTLADGTTYNVQLWGEAGNILTIQLITEESLGTLFNVFYDPLFTQSMSFSYGKEPYVYDGFTRLIMIQDQRWNNGNVMIQLRKEVTNNGQV